MEIPDMQHQIMGYDRSTTMFSPEGHILQVEYAEKTARLGSASIGMICSDGAIIIADKGIKDSLIVSKSADKIYEIDEHIMASAAGIISDARVLIDRARIVSQQHRITYDSPIEIESIIKEISDIKQQYTQHPGVRPFGVAIMVAGVNDGRPRLYITDITGNYFEYKAIAIGKKDNKIKELLRKKYKKEIKIKEGIKIALEIFSNVLKEDFDIQRFNVAQIKNSDGKIINLNKEEILKYK